MKTKARLLSLMMQNITATLKLDVAKIECNDFHKIQMIAENKRYCWICSKKYTQNYFARNSLRKKLNHYKQLLERARIMQ
jgi:hypothetical protein